MAEGKYGQVTTTRKDFAAEDPDEPLFLLRAQDTLAPMMLRLYAQIVASHGLLDVAYGVAMQELAMREWQAIHPDRLKLPD